MTAQPADTSQLQVKPRAFLVHRGLRFQFQLQVLARIAPLADLLDQLVGRFVELAQQEVTARVRSVSVNRISLCVSLHDSLCISLCVSLCVTLWMPHRVS